jgi:hypothetical protein
VGRGEPKLRPSDRAADAAVDSLASRRVIARLAGFPPRDLPMGPRACCGRVSSNNIYESATAVFQPSVSP